MVVACYRLEGIGSAPWHFKCLDYTLLSDGRYYIEGSYTPIGGGEAKTYIIADLKIINNEKIWTFYKINKNELNISTLLTKEISVLLNNNVLSFSQPPYIENGTTRVPMRAIFEALNAEVDYEAATKTITVRKGSTIIKLITGASTATINGREMTLTASVENRNGSTMVPLRFVSEALGAEVIWDGKNKIITINLVEGNINNETSEAPTKVSTDNPFASYSNEIYNIYDNRNNILDAVAWSWSNLTYGIEHILDIDEKPQNIEYGKLVLANILSKVPEIQNEPVDTSGYVSASSIMSGGVSIATEYFGASSKETKLLEESIKKLGDVIDWTAFSTEEIDYILKDYKISIQYLDLLRTNCDDEYVNDLIDELIQDYTNKWYKTVIDINEKIVDGTVDKGLDAGLGIYTAGLYPLAKYSNEVVTTLSGLKGKTDSLANFYLVCLIIQPVDKAYEKCVNKYNNGDCNISDVQASFELDKATKIYAYECIKEFANKSDKEIAETRIFDIERINMKNGIIENFEGSGGGKTGGR